MFYGIACVYRYGYICNSPADLTLIEKKGNWYGKRLSFSGYYYDYMYSTGVVEDFPRRYNLLSTHKTKWNEMIWKE